MEDTKVTRYVICPMCGRNRVMHTSKGKISFVVVDPESAPCIDFRSSSGGRGSGFPRISTLSIEEMKSIPEYKDLLVEMREQAARIYEAIGDIDDDKG